MNRRDFLAGLLCAVATLNLGAGGSTSLANTRAPEEVTTEPLTENDLAGLKLSYTRRRRHRAAGVVIGTAVIMGTAAIIIATAIEGAETGTGMPGEVGAGSEYAPHPSRVSLAVGMVGIERSRSTEA